MTEKLDSFRPTPQMYRAIKQLLQRAGIPEDEIPLHWIEPIAAATTKYYMTTQDGLNDFSRLFCFNGKRGDADKDYTLVDNIERKVIDVRREDVWLFEGALVNGFPVALADSRREGPTPALELEVCETNKERCEECGIISHCIKEVRDPCTTRLTSLCNFCMTYHEHPRVNENGGLGVCKECSTRGCNHHPEELRA